MGIDYDILNRFLKKYKVNYFKIKNIKNMLLLANLKKYHNGARL